MNCRQRPLGWRKFRSPFLPERSSKRVRSFSIACPMVIPPENNSPTILFASFVWYLFSSVLLDMLIRSLRCFLINCIYEKAWAISRFFVEVLPVSGQPSPLISGSDHDYEFHFENINPVGLQSGKLEDVFTLECPTSGEISMSITVDAREAADMFKVHFKTLLDLIAKGAIPASKSERS